MLLVLAEEVAHGEVVECESHASDDTGLSPTQRELHLVVGLLLKHPVEVDGTAFVVGLDVRVDLFRVEVSHGGDLTIGTHDGLLGEQVAGLGAQLTSYHFLVEAVVAIDADVAQVGLRTFQHTHLQVDGVA